MAKIVVKCMDLRVGDVIHACGHTAEVMYMTPWFTEYEVLSDPKDTGNPSGHGSSTIVKFQTRAKNAVRVTDETRYTTQFFHVERKGTTATAQKATDTWNGKCPSCGKNIYIGFMKTEHEGGKCR